MPCRPVPTATGAWWLPANATASRYYFDPGFAGAVANLSADLGCTTLLDVGAGVGRYVSFYRARGLDAVGVDGLSDAENRSHGLVRQLDLAIERMGCRVAEVVACMEVLEHVPAAFEAQVVAQLACAPTRRLILSWAPPHQSGNGHVNPRAPGYVLQAFAAHGWRPHAAETAALRRASALPWYRSNAFSFSFNSTA